LVQTVAALKATQGLAPRSYTQILQELAKEIPNLVKTSGFHQKVSEVNTSNFTFDGEAPSSGAFTSDGKIFCGTYKRDHWFSDAVQPHRVEITELRAKHQPEGRPAGKDAAQHKNQVRKHQRTVKALKQKNTDFNLKLASLKSVNKDDEAGPQPVVNAGDAFGGRDSMTKPP
jgi:hypothetical protein